MLQVLCKLAMELNLEVRVNIIQMKLENLIECGYLMKCLNFQKL